MPAATPAIDLPPIPASGRRFLANRSVRLGDVDPKGLLRLDAIARHLQDVASDDAVDSGLDTPFGWVVRRTLVDVRRPPGLGELLELTTFCSGTGRSWAERRTSIVGDRGGAVEAVSLWVQVDSVTGRPRVLGDGFCTIYGEAAGGRRVSSRLILPGPSAHASTRPWPLRVVDLDVFDHVNNAAHWPILEEAITGGGRVGTAEMEHLAPVGMGTAVTLHIDATAGPMAWLVADGRVSSAARWRTGGGFTSGS